MNALKWILVGLVVNFSVLGCAVRDQVITPYEETLYYELAYDLAYLRTLEAVQEVDGWQLDVTDKERGIIRVQNTQFGRLDDADNRRVELVLKREGSRLTSLSVSPETQHVVGTEEFMKKVNDFIAPSLKP